jgi:hypothetical protein
VQPVKERRKADVLDNGSSTSVEYSSHGSDINIQLLDMCHEIKRRLAQQ